MTFVLIFMKATESNSAYNDVTKKISSNGYFCLANLSCLYRLSQKHFSSLCEM